MITPTAGRGAIFQELNPGHKSAPDVRAGQAVAVSVSPDGQSLVILTSGFNLFNVHFSYPDPTPIAELSTEYVFLFDVSAPQPKQLQVLLVPNTFQGLSWAPSSDRFFVSGGKDDTVLEFVRNGSTFALGRTFRLGHKVGVGLNAKPMVGGLAVSPDGTRLLVANLQNDSVSLIDLVSGHVVAEQDLRPGIIDPKHHGQPGGSFPRCLAWTSSDQAYVGSERDREIISLAIPPANTNGARIRIGLRIPVRGQPIALVANRRGSRLYAALDDSDEAAIIDTGNERLIETVDAAAPASVYANTRKLGGANSNAVALTPDERTLLVSNGGENAVAVVRLSDRARGLASPRENRERVNRDNGRGPQIDHSEVTGLVPTGWYPTGVAISKDGSTWYVVNGKSETGPNLSWCQEEELSAGRCITKNKSGRENPENSAYKPWTIYGTLSGQNQNVFQLEKAGFLTLPVPSTQELAGLTKQVVHNNHFDWGETTADVRLFSFLREHIKHVVYVVKENRTYDQVLGDLEIGNGDPRLTLFPENNTPNHHALARNFTTLDNFLVSGEVSWSGWDWSASAQTNDFREREEPLLAAGRGLQEDTGPNRNINMGYATSAERKVHDPLSPSDPDILAGARDVSAPDGPDGEEGKGYLWDAALRRGLTIRNWGFYGDSRDYSASNPLVRNSYAKKLRVFFPTKASLMPYSDPYFRGWEPALPDYWRVREWKREFDTYSRSRTAPNLMLIRLCTDHFGDFDRAIDDVNTVDTQMADNDYAIGLIAEAVANSPFANDTLILSIEDDAGDGLDHVDSHRSVVLVAGPYVRHHAVVSTRYTTVSVVKTIEEILGIGPIGLNDARAAPMSEVFDPNVATWSYKATVPEVLYSTKLPLPRAEHAFRAVPSHSAAYWTKVMAGQDFSGPDRINPVTFNRALWRGLKGNEPYPGTQTRGQPRKAGSPSYWKE